MRIRTRTPPPHNMIIDGNQAFGVKLAKRLSGEPGSAREAGSVPHIARYTGSPGENSAFSVPLRSGQHRRPGPAFVEHVKRSNSVKPRPRRKPRQLRGAVNRKVL